MRAVLTSVVSCFDVPLAGGRVCQVRFVCRPGQAPDAGWPVAYVLDLKQFDAMAQDPSALPGVLVGLGPAVPEDRRWDYVPQGWSRARAGAADGPGFTGAARWWRALVQVRACIAAQLALDPHRQVFCGHSLGALFGWYVLLHQARAFDGYVLSSPSVWWGDRYAWRLWQRRAAWLRTQGLPRLGLRLSVGEYEQGLSPQEQQDTELTAAQRQQRQQLRQARAMIDQSRVLIESLAQCPGLRLTYAVLPGQTHRSAAGAALLPGWQALLNLDAPPAG